MRGKTIRQFLIEGAAEGRWICELSNWTGKAYKIPRTYVSNCEDRADLEYTGVYFLFGQNDETGAQQVYIGEAENVINRVKQHVAGKDFWTECIVFISKDNNLNKAHIKYLENRLYMLAKASKRYEIVNSNIPTESSISEMDRAEMDEFIDNVRLLLRVMGHKMLDPAVSVTQEEHTDTLYIKRSQGGPSASGKMVADGFIVLKGSTIADVVSSSLMDSIVQKRQRLIDDGVIENNVFSQDWTFTSPSLAAAIVVGYSINGRIAWKNTGGITLKELEETSALSD